MMPDPTRTNAIQQRAPWRQTLHEVIFEADTLGGKLFDIALLIAIFASVLAVILDSVQEIKDQYHAEFIGIEWFFTILFTIEYGLRLISVGRPLKYAMSFYGIVDLLAILPTYILLFLPPDMGPDTLIVVRALRLLRVFRVFKLAQFLTEASELRKAILASRAKITVFLSAVLVIVVIMGAAMHLIEGPEHGFTSIPQSMYWAIVTMTTVGYGDIAPETAAGKFVAAVVMFLGYSMIIIPTGIITSEIAIASSRKVSTQACPQCSKEGHDFGANFCKYCGAQL